MHGQAGGEAVDRLLDTIRPVGTAALPQRAGPVDLYARPLVWMPLAGQHPSGVVEGGQRGVDERVLAGAELQVGQAEAVVDPGPLVRRRVLGQGAQGEVGRLLRQRQVVPEVAEAPHTVELAKQGDRLHPLLRARRVTRAKCSGCFGRPIDRYAVIVSSDREEWTIAGALVGTFAHPRESDFGCR